MQSVTILHNLSDILSRSKSYHPREVMSCLLWEPRIVQRQMRHKFMSISYMYWEKLLCVDNRILHFTYEGEQLNSPFAP
ncbi:hypothetical protein BT93_H2413 [Corymbia citriodora subsp. variegata]|nr:hypothetical protein BT93_H2413 [Corymbia citriodora subsp. variegata]